MQSPLSRPLAPTIPSNKPSKKFMSNWWVWIMSIRTAGPILLVWKRWIWISMTTWIKSRPSSNAFKSLRRKLCISSHPNNQRSLHHRQQLLHNLLNQNRSHLSNNSKQITRLHLSKTQLLLNNSRLRPLQRHPSHQSRSPTSPMKSLFWRNKLNRRRKCKSSSKPWLLNARSYSNRNLKPSLTKRFHRRSGAS